ncbi:MAG: hypothetical protein KatS3mg026_1374 [Bacteroidia bacterium]|nr:MAG: hypothetical protein KatS3mg026_1374 [Bacteroidia bacterium]
MRIALVGPAYPFRGGLAAFNERLAAELLAQGHQVRLFTFTVQYPAWLFPGKTQYREGPPPTPTHPPDAAFAESPLLAQNWPSYRRFSA